MSDGPYLTTDRFDLWIPRVSDLDGLIRLVSDDETRRFLGPTRAEPAAQWERLTRNAGSWSLYGYGIFYVRERGKEALIASCGLFHSWRGIDASFDDEPEAGWIVRQDHWGRGVAAEVMTVVHRWFDAEHGPRRTVCMIEDGNTASERVAAKLGYVRYKQLESEDDRAVLNIYERLP